ncbi:hypothetical protein E2C01_030718 [Portunus trituberculatus]|uniref:Uncharacterized protein n=1 Tax=Portunus trituberculatus TaxID=210409 RepID=A0A5B7EY45_PORTR|nr:hypothetical protein [Portunus trituberculatus]
MRSLYEFKATNSLPVQWKFSVSEGWAPYLSRRESSLTRSASLQMMGVSSWVGVWLSGGCGDGEGDTVPGPDPLRPDPPDTVVKACRGAPRNPRTVTASATWSA